MIATCFKDTHRKKAPLNKTQVLRKSINMGVWVVVIINQLLIKVSYIKIKFSKKMLSVPKHLHFQLWYFQVNHSTTVF